MSLASREAWAGSGLIEIGWSPAALWFAYSQGGDILCTTLLIKPPILPRTCKPGVSSALLNGDFGISPHSPPFALLI